jgi:hypothetical protein
MALPLVNMQISGLFRTLPQAVPLHRPDSSP